MAGRVLHLERRDHSRTIGGPARVGIVYSVKLDGTVGLPFLGNNF